MKKSLHHKSISCVASHHYATMSSPTKSGLPSDLEVRSECAASSSPSRRSTRSSISIAAAEARAKAEAARTKADYTKRQIEMKVERARLDAMLTALQEEGEAESALAAAKALEAAAEGEGVDEQHSIRSPIASSAKPEQRTADFVQAHFVQQQQQQQEQPMVNTAQPHPKDEPAASQVPPPAQLPQSVGSYDPHPRSAVPTPYPHPSYHVDATGSPYGVRNWPDPHLPIRADISDLSAHLARRDLLSAGLKVFDNRPETYLSWKASFHNAKQGLSLRPGEELDLLTRWLEGESLQHVQRIRAVNIRDPAAGLIQVWQRLDRKYGSPEAIEAALFTRLEDFPRIASKEHLRLEELADLLKEVRAAKLEGGLPGLSFLDTTRGTNQIVAKLPHHLQEKWMAQGTMYKKAHGVPFPPFTFFVDFVDAQAEMRTDPSFAFRAPTVLASGVDKPSSQRFKAKAAVSVHKTQVGNSMPPPASDARPSDPDRQCPIHKCPHSLKKCRGFRAKPLEERKAFLKQQGICFKCCASTHMAKDCKVDIRCAECDSDRHVSALHDGPPPWAEKRPPPMEDHGGEQATAQPIVTTTHCTDICGKGLSGKSCSKICLANVYPEKQPERAKKMYVVLDDQSNHSLARSTFFDTFDIQADAAPYILRTCSGTVTTNGRRTSGFRIQSLDGRVELSLPPLIECDSIPNNRDEIPTREAAKHHPHLSVIADEIPLLDPSAEILLLLSRDAIQAHKVRKQCNGPHDAPYAQCLDLGWVIVGDVCLGKAHKPTVNAFKTSILPNGRPSFLSPCENVIHVKETFEAPVHSPRRQHPDTIGSDVFGETAEDYKLATSVEDKIFLSIINTVCQERCQQLGGPAPFSLSSTASSRQ